jgi:hypothetical protein
VGFVRSCLPVVPPGFAHEWAHGAVRSPRYFIDPLSGTHVLYVRGHWDDGQSGIGYVTSPDGVAWSGLQGPILTPSPGEWDEEALLSPAVAYLPGASNPYVMLYGAAEIGASPISLGVATSTSPTGPFVRVEAQSTAPIAGPKLEPATTGLDDLALADAALHEDGGILYAWYAGRASSDLQWRVFRATSADGGASWTRTDLDANGADLVVDSSTLQWSVGAVGAPSVLPDFSAATAEAWVEVEGTSVGAVEGTLQGWQDAAGDAVLVPAGACERIDGLSAGAPAVHFDGPSDTYRMFYEATTSYGASCLGNALPVWDNAGGEVSWVGEAVNVAPALSDVTISVNSFVLSISGQIADTAPDTVEISVKSSINNNLGFATVLPVGPSSAVQTTSFSHSIGPLSLGLHTITVTATDAAGVARSVTDTVLVQ